MTTYTLNNNPKSVNLRLPKDLKFYSNLNIRVSSLKWEIDCFNKSQLSGIFLTFLNLNFFSHVLKQLKNKTKVIFLKQKIQKFQSFLILIIVLV